MPYSSDLTDAEWEIFEPLLLEILPKKKQTRKRRIIREKSGDTLANI
jgi:transposase